MRSLGIRNEITGKQMVVHVGNSSTVDDVLELERLFETEGVGPVGKFKKVKVDADNESEEESDTKGDYTSVKEVHVNMNNFSFTAYPKHDTSIGGVDVLDDDLDVIDYDSFGSNLDDGIDSERRIQVRWEVRTLIEDHTCIQSRAIKACTSRFLADHVIKSLATNPYIPVRAVQDQMQKQFEVGVSKINAFRVKRIASDIMTDSYREQYSLLREYAQELIN
ncbi:hypothetical protein Tco_1550830 [Tanacetum coccineum]